MFPLGSRKYFFFPFFFADCHPPASVNGTRHVPLGQSETSRLVSRVKLLSAGTEPQDTSKKKPGNQFCLQRGGRRVWVSALCQDLLSRQREIEYARAEPAVPLCCGTRVPGEGADAAHRQLGAAAASPPESPGQEVPGLLLGNGVEAAFGQCPAARPVCQGCCS